MRTVLDVLVARGPASAAELRQELGVASSTLHRALGPHRESLLVVGRSRAIRYAARRLVEGLRTPIRVYEVGPEGAATHALTLHPVEPLGFYVEGKGPAVDSGFCGTRRHRMGVDAHSELPWFLQDLKPTGFLGRAWLRAHLDGGFPPDLARWTADDVLRYAALYGTNLLGGWVVGEYALEATQAWIRHSDRPEISLQSLPLLAERALAGAAWGSSVGGEQPKFLGWRGNSECIVKFSPPIDSPAGRRWADLLVAEHLVHVVLGSAGIGSCRSEIIDAGSRRFLVVERFDRLGNHGRLGVVSLGPLDSQGVAGELRRWSAATEGLGGSARGPSGQGHLPPPQVPPPVQERIRWLEAFGVLIANTDMHPGNLALRLDGTHIVGLAPVYDMLPMYFAPRFGGELPRGAYLPTAERSDFPETACTAAQELWERVALDARVSADFVAVARAQARLVPVGAARSPTPP
jgi:HipA-like C-terminal domain